MTTTVTTSFVMQGAPKLEGLKKHQGRLPVIAPKDDVSSSSSSSRSRSANTSTSTAPIPSRARLPPRSRTGCWTCRTRKVKCDEGRPVCGQCSRLGHTCDYSPRLSFRDDTRRVVDRMQDVSIVASPVWDPSSPPTADGARDSAELEDDLPPFSTLSNDEDRERKAESQTPGTFHVVVNQESFATHPEYSEEVVDSPISLTRRGSLAHSLASGIGRDLLVGEVLATEDPNTVIVRRFEDFSRKALVISRDPKLPVSPIRLKAQTSLSSEHDEPFDETESAQHSNPSKGRHASPDGTLIQQFRNKVWPQLAQLDSILTDTNSLRDAGVDIIENIASAFAPCAHALRAVAATALTHQNGEQKLDGLHHHQQVLTELQSNLRSADDLTSDGTFLTHFLLLIYEIVAAQTVGSNLWSQQLTQLLRISLMRREALGGERYPFIIWWICNIDLQALFSGAGTGDFVETLLKDDMMPPPLFHLCPLNADGGSIIYEEEADTLPLLLQVNYEVTLLACRIGLLARELRSEILDFSSFVTDLTPSLPNPTADTKMRQRRVFELQQSLRQLWIDSDVAHLRSSINLLPPRPCRVLEHAIVLSHSALIYSFTSMWPTQRLDTGAEYETEIENSVQEILQISTGVINGTPPRVECRFIVFPLFMAGVASASGVEKMMALDLIRRMEKYSIGPNTKSTREMLQLIYERQTQRFMSTGQSLDVNWMDVMLERGGSVINFGL